MLSLIRLTSHAFIDYIHDFIHIIFILSQIIFPAFINQLHAFIDQIACFHRLDSCFDRLDYFFHKLDSRFNRLDYFIHNLDSCIHKLDFHVFVDLHLQPFFMSISSFPRLSYYFTFTIFHSQSFKILPLQFHIQCTITLSLHELPD